MAEYICGAIIEATGRLRYIGVDSGEADTWRVALGWPDKEEIADAKRRGMRFARVSVREALPVSPDKEAHNG